MIPSYRGFSIDGLSRLTSFDDVIITADERHGFRGMARRPEVRLATTSSKENTATSAFHIERPVSPEHNISAETSANTRTNDSTFPQWRPYFDDSPASCLSKAESQVSALTHKIELLENQSLSYESDVKRLKAESVQEILSLKAEHEYEVRSIKDKYNKKIQSQEKELLKCTQVFCEANNPQSKDRIQESSIDESEEEDRAVLLLLRKMLKDIIEKPHSDVREQIQRCARHIE